MPDNNKDKISSENLELALKSKAKGILTSETGNQGPLIAAFGNTDFGDSKYDDDKLSSEYIKSGDYNYFRGARQSHWDKAANGITRAVGAAAQTLYDGTAGIGYGIIRYSSDLALDELNKQKHIAEHGSLEGYKSPSWTTIFDNEATRAGEELVKGLEDVMPLYGSREYENASGLEKLKYMNFWADDVLKGIGTTVGSMPLGMVGSKLYNAIGKNFVAGKLANGVRTSLTGTENLEKVLLDQAKKIKLYNAGDKLVASTFAAVSEAGMEARGAGDRLRQELLAEITQNGTREATQGELDWLEQVVDDAKKSAFGTNMAIITGTDFLTFGKYMTSNKSAKYLDDLEKTSSKLNVNAGSRVTRKPIDGSNLAVDYTATEYSKGYKIARAAYNATKRVLGTNVGEGVEENLQTATEHGVIDFGKQKYYGKQDAESYLHALGAAVEGATSGEGIESFLAGFISGGISNTMLSKGQNIKEMFSKDPVVNNAINNLNLYSSKSVFGELIKSVAESQAAGIRMDNALNRKDDFGFKNAQSDLATSYVLSRIKTGKYEDLQQDLEEFKQMPQEEIEKLFGVKIGEDGKSTIFDFLESKISKAKEIKKIHDASYVVFPEGTISDNNRDRLIHANVSILDSQKRIESINKDILDKTTNLPENHTGSISTINLSHFTRPNGEVVNYNNLVGKQRSEVNAEIVRRLEASSIAPVEIPGIFNQLHDSDRLTVRRDAYKDIYNTLLDPKKAEALDKEDAVIEAQLQAEKQVEIQKQQMATDYKNSQKEKIEKERTEAIAAAQAEAEANGQSAVDIDTSVIDEEARKKYEYIESLDQDSAIKAAQELELEAIKKAEQYGEAQDDSESYDTYTKDNEELFTDSGELNENAYKNKRILGHIYEKNAISKKTTPYYDVREKDGIKEYLDLQGNPIGSSLTHIESIKASIADTSNREVFNGPFHFNLVHLGKQLRDRVDYLNNVLTKIINLGGINSLKDYIRIVVSQNPTPGAVIPLEGNNFFDFVTDSVNTQVIITDPETKADLQTLNYLKNPLNYTPKKIMILDGVTYKPGDVIDFTKLSYETFKKYFTTKQNSDISETDFEVFKQATADMNKFRQQIINFYEGISDKSLPVTLPENLFNLTPSWQFNYIQKDNVPYPNISEVKYAKDKDGKYVIYQSSIGSFMKGSDTKDGDISEVPDAPGTWMKLFLPDGTSKWLQVRPAKVVESKNIKNRIQEAAEKLEKLPAGDTSKNEALKIIQELGMFVAGSPGQKLDFGFGWNSKLNKFTLRFNVNKKSIDMSEPESEGSKLTMLDETLDRFINRINYYLKQQKQPANITKESFREDTPGQNSDTSKPIADNYVSTAYADSPVLASNIKVIPTGETIKPETSIAKKDITAKQTISEEKTSNTTEDKAKEAINKHKATNQKGVTRKKRADKLSSTSAKEKINLTEAFEYLRGILPESIELGIIEDNFKSGKMVWGYFSDSLLALSAKAGKGTEFHEAFHAVFRTFLDNRQIEIYLNEAKRETNYTPAQEKDLVDKIKKTYAEDNLTDKQALDLVYEEYLADKFMDWKNDIRTKTSVKNKSLFRKILDFIKSFLKHKSHIDKLFERIDTGDFKYADPIVNRYTYSNKIAYKALPGLTIAETKDMVNTIAATVMETGMNPDLAIAEYIDNILDPDSDFNKSYVSKNSDLKKELEFKYAVAIDDYSISILREAVGKKVVGYKYDPITESFEQAEENENSLENWQFDFFNVGGVDLLGEDIRKLIGLTLYETTDKYGRKIKKAIDLDSVYNTIMTNMVDTPSNKFMSKLEVLGKYNPEIKALYAKIKNATTDRGLAGEQLMKKIHKAFERTKMNYLTIRSTNTGTFNIFDSNTRSSEKRLFDKWSNNWLGNYQDKFKNNPALGKAFAKRIGSINQVKNNASQFVKDGVLKIGNENFQSYVVKTFSQIGIDITEGTVDLLFTPVIDGVNDIELNALRSQYNTVEGVTDNFWTNLKALVEKGDPLFKGQLETKDKKATGFVGELKKLANSDKLFRSDLFETSIQDANYKQRYAFVMQSYLSDTVQDIKNKYTDSKNIQEAIDDSYLSKNPLFKMYPQSLFGVFKNVNLFFTGDLIETAGTDFKRVENVDGVTAKNIKPKEYLLNMLLLFADSKLDTNSGITTAKYIIGVEESKSQVYAVNLPVSNTITDSKTGELTEDGISQFFNSLFSQELDRIIKAKDARLKSSSPEKQSKKELFVYFPALNDKTTFAKFHEALDNINNDRQAFDNQAKEALKEIFNNELKDLTALVKDYKLEGRLKQAIEKEGSLEGFLGKALANDFLMSSAIDQLIDGDLSNYKDIVDKWKRNGGRVAAGTNRSGRTISIAYTTNSKSKGDVEVSGESEIDTDDAQVYSTLQDRINLLEDLGRLDDNTKDILERLNSDDPNVVYGVTPEEEKSVDLVSSKLVTYGVDDNGNHIYHKMSVFPLIKKFTSMYDYKAKQWVAIPGREKLHNKRVWMEKNNIDQLVPLSASKLQNSGNIIDHTTFEKSDFDTNFGSKQTKKGSTNQYKSSYNGKYQRLQVENESGSHIITNGTQKIQVITSGLDMSKKENQDDVSNYYSKLNELREKLFSDALRLLSTDGKRKKDISLFIDKLLRNAESSGGNFILEQFLQEEGGDFKYDPNLPHLLSQFEKYFLAHFNKGVLIQKTSGNKLTLVSSDGFKIMTKTEGADKGKILTSEEFIKDPSQKVETRDLKIHKIKDGKLQYAEVAMTKRSADLLGLKIGDEITEEQLKTMLGSRIPTQLQHSLMPFKVVEFLPDAYGDVLIGPKELVWLSGADFDIDKLYSYKKSYYVTKDGEVKLFGTGSEYEEYRISQRRTKMFKDAFRKKLSLNPEYVQLAKRLKVIEDFLYKDPFVVQNSRKVAALNEGISQAISLLKSIRGTDADTTSLREELNKAFLTRSSISNFLDKLAKSKPLVQNALNGQTYNDLLKELEKLTDETSIKVFEEFGLPATSEQYNSSKEKHKAYETLQNNLLDLEFKLLNKPELAERMKTPASIDTLKELTNKLTENKKLPKAGLAMGLLSKFQGKRSIDVGKENIGIAANGNILNAWLTTNRISVKDDYSIVIDGKRYNTFAELMEDDYVIEDGKFKFVKKDKSDTISTELSAATDNAKEQLADLVNRTPAILNTIIIMQSLSVGQTRSTLMAVQPIMKEVVRDLELANSNIDKQELKHKGTRLYTFTDILKSKVETLFDEIKKEVEAISDDKQKLKFEAELLENNLTSEQLLEIFNKNSYNTIEDKIVQLNVIKNFLAAEEINKSNTKLLRLLKVNKGVGSELNELNDIIDAYEGLSDKKAELPYTTDFQEKFKNNANISGNYHMTRRIKNIARDFFIKETPGYKMLSSELKKLFPNKEGWQAKAAVSSMLDFLNLKLYEKILKTELEDSNFTLGQLNTLAYPGYKSGSKTIVKTFYELSDKFEEFSNNDLVKWLRVVPAGENYNRFDKLSIDTRSKLSNDILEKFSESVKQMYNSDNQEISDFALSLFDYLVVTNNLKFSNDSVIKFLGPEFFQSISNGLKQLTTTLNQFAELNVHGKFKNKSKDDVELNKKLVSLTGLTFRELQDTFVELYARGTKTGQDIINASSDNLNKTFNVKIEEKVLTISPKDVKKVVGNGIIEATDSEQEGLNIKYPRFLKSSTYSPIGELDTRVFRRERIDDTTATYVEVEKLNNHVNPIWHMTVTEAEEYTKYIRAQRAYRDNTNYTEEQLDVISEYTDIKDKKNKSKIFESLEDATVEMSEEQLQEYNEMYSSEEEEYVLPQDVGVGVYREDDFDLSSAEDYDFDSAEEDGSNEDKDSPEDLDECKGDK